MELPRLVDLAQLDDAGFRALFSGSPIKRTGRDRFVRNVLIALGNSGNPAAVKDGLDAQTTQGLINTAYKLPNYRVVSILKNTHVPLGPWRAPGHSQNVFFIESFFFHRRQRRSQPLHV